MQVSIESTSNIERRITIAVPADVLDSKVDQKLAEVAKTARINGFRKGKVPLKVVKKQYGAAINQEVAGDLINSSYIEALQQESVRPAGQPQIEVTSLETGKDLEYVATVEVYPDVELGDLSGFEVTRLSAEINDDDIEAMITKLREQQASFAEVERAAADGDQVTIDFVGTKDGEEFDGGKSEGHKLVLGSKSMIPGFESGIEGMKVGEVKDLPLTFPEDYQVEDLKGADVLFKITLHKVEEKTLPEVDAEFMKKFNADTEEQFKTDIRANMERELARATQGKVKTAVMDQLLEKHELELPSALVDSEIGALREQMMQQFGGMQQNKNLDLKSLLPDDMFKEQAEKRVGLGLVLSEVVKVNEIKADADRVRAFIEEAAASYESPEDVVNYYYQNEQLLASAESAVLEDMVVEYILEKTTVAEKTVTYAEAVENQEA